LANNKKKQTQWYWGTEEYEQDQRNFEKGGQSPETVFAVAQRWGIEFLVAHLAGKTRDVYIQRRIASHLKTWEKARCPYQFDEILHGKVLDLGCGAASVLEGRDDSIDSLIAIDPALKGYVAGAPHIAQIGQVGKCFYVSGVIQDITDEDFDAIYSFNAIDHGVDWENIIEHCYRVLKPGGYLMLGVHVCSKPRTGYHRRLTHPSHFPHKALLEQIARAGFEVSWYQDINPYLRKPVFLSLTVARKPC